MKTSRLHPQTRKLTEQKSPRIPRFAPISPFPVSGTEVAARKSPRKSQHTSLHTPFINASPDTLRCTAHNSRCVSSTREVCRSTGVTKLTYPYTLYRAYIFEVQYENRQ